MNCVERQNECRVRKLMAVFKNLFECTCSKTTLFNFYNRIP